MQISEPSCVSHRATEGHWASKDHTPSPPPHLENTKTRVWNKNLGVSSTAVKVCQPKMEPYMVPVLHCCSDERGWSSSARWHGNVTEGSELGSSLRCCHSSVSPRHWFDRETERRTPSEVEKNETDQADVSEWWVYFYFSACDRRLPFHRTPTPHPPRKEAGQQPPQTTAFVSERPA